MPTKKPPSGNRKPSTSKTTTRKPATRKPSSKNTPKSGLRREAWGIIYILIGILTLVTLLTPTGAFSALYVSLFGALLGYGTYVLVPTLIGIGVLMTVKPKGRIVIRLIALGLMPLLISLIAHCVIIGNTTPLDITSISKLFETGAELKSGGFFGGALAIMFMYGITPLGTMIIVPLLLLTCIAIGFNISPVLVYRKIKDLLTEYDDEDDFDDEPMEEPKTSKPTPKPINMAREPQKTEARVSEPPKPPQKTAPRKPHASLFEKFMKKDVDVPVDDFEDNAEKVQNNFSETPYDAEKHKKPDEVIKFQTPEGEVLDVDPNTGEVLDNVVPFSPNAFSAAPIVQDADVASYQDTPPWEDMPTGVGMPNDPSVFGTISEDELTAEEMIRDIDKILEDDPIASFNHHDTHTETQVPQRNTSNFDLEVDDKSDIGEDKVGQIITNRSIHTEGLAAARAERIANQDKPPEPPKYNYPPISLLKPFRSTAGDATQELRDSSERLLDTLASFNIDAEIINIVRGPSITRFEIQIPRGVKFSKITGLSDDIALSLGAPSVRIAPIPDKVAIGIELPNVSTQMVFIREVLASNEFKKAESKLTFAIGKDITGNAVVGDIAGMPHMLIAGATGAGKSVCINSLILSILYKANPEEVKLIMIDPKMVELGIYNGIPHLLIPVVTDPKKASGALSWAVAEMMRRYKLMSDANVRDLESYNKAAKKFNEKPAETDPETGETLEKYLMPILPQIVIVIDELADLMMVAAREVEEAICRIAQLARAAGMHLIIATQRPSSDVITGLMKTNIPSRIAFSVASSIDSRIILDQTGAEKLIGKGDMLYAPRGVLKPLRIQGCFLSGEEVEAVVEHVKQTATPEYDEEVMAAIEKSASEGGSAPSGDAGGSDSMDEALIPAIDIVVQTGQASTSMLQRKLRLGYGRASRIIDEMEERGIVGGSEGSKPRQVLITSDQWQEMKMRMMD